jgi:hypothetical protein
MNFTLDHVDPQQGVLNALSETITAFSEDVSDRLAPIHVQFDSLNFEDVDDDGKTELLLKGFAQEVWADPNHELTANVSANLIVIGETEVNRSTEFLIDLKLRDTNRLEVEVRSPVGFTVHKGDIAAVYAKQISDDLIGWNAFCAAESK